MTPPKSLSFVLMGDGAASVAVLYVLECFDQFQNFCFLYARAGGIMNEDVLLSS